MLAYIIIAKNKPKTRFPSFSKYSEFGIIYLQTCLENFNFNNIIKKNVRTKIYRATWIWYESWSKKCSSPLNGIAIAMIVNGSVPKYSKLIIFYITDSCWI